MPTILVLRKARLDTLRSASVYCQEQGTTNPLAKAKMNRKILLLLALIAVVAGVTLTMTGCDSASNPVAPAGSILTLTANPTRITPNGEASIITVTGFRPDGNSLNPGSLITLTTDLGTLGTNSLAIDNEGRAQTTLTSDGRTGPATVTAVLTSSSEATASATVQIEALVPNLSVFANPGTIGVGGRSDITVIARDNNNFPLGAGNRIRLIAEFGTLSATNITTNADGEAFSRFIAGDRPEQGTVTAFLENNDTSTSSVNINIVDAPTSFSFNTDVGRVSASSEAMIEVTVEVLNSLGSPLPGASVTFEVEDANGGSVGGTFESGSFIQTTDNGGRVVDTLTIPQGELDAGIDVLLRATVRGEGVELPTQTIRVTVDP